jgi:hypothetical protein
MKFVPFGELRMSSPETGRPPPTRLLAGRVWWVVHGVRAGSLVLSRMPPRLPGDG